jgi:hypothetical protein
MKVPARGGVMRARNDVPDTTGGLVCRPDPVPVDARGFAALVLDFNFRGLAASQHDRRAKQARLVLLTRRCWFRRIVHRQAIERNLSRILGVITSCNLRTAVACAGVVACVASGSTVSLIVVGLSRACGTSRRSRLWDIYRTLEPAESGG